MPASINFTQNGTGAVARPLSSRLEDVYSVKDFGAVGDGTTNDRGSLDTAATAAAGRSLFFPQGTYRITSNLTIGATVQCVFDRGAQITVDSGVTLTISGPVSASDDAQIFAGAGSFVVAKVKNPRQSVLWYPSASGSDIGERFNLLKAAATNGPVKAVIPPGSYTFDEAMNAIDSTRIHITSESGGDIGDTVITWTGAASSGSAIKANGSRGFEFSNIMLTYSNAAYDGNLLTLSSAGGGQLTTHTHLHHCRVVGQSGATGAARLVEVNQTLNATIGPKCFFDYAAIGIGATGDSNNGVKIVDNWFDLNFTTAKIVGQGTNWRVSDNIFESGSTLTKAWSQSGTVTALTFSNNLMVDGGGEGGTLFDATGQGLKSAHITGNTFSGASGTAVEFSATAGQTSGVMFAGNVISGMAYGVSLGKATGVALMGNSWVGLTAAFTGTEPTKISVLGNDSGEAAMATHASVADDAVVTIATNENMGTGHISVFVTVENQTAIYALRGAGDATNEVSDPGGIFEPTDMDNRVCIYYNGAGAYVLKNRMGSTRSFIVNNLGGR